MTEEQRAWQSKVHMGQPMSEASRVALLKANTGRHMTQKNREALLAVHVGSHKSDACKAAISRANSGKCPSLETRAKMSVSHMGNGWRMTPEGHASLSARRGPLSNSWKGGITPANVVLHNSLDYATWRRAVYGRDDFTCQVCGKRGGAIEAHHINNFAEHEDKRFDIENGATLCDPCHKKFHSIFSNRHNTLQELQTFVMAQEA